MGFYRIIDRGLVEGDSLDRFWSLLASVFSIVWFGDTIKLSMVGIY